MKLLEEFKIANQTPLQSQRNSASVLEQSGPSLASGSMPSSGTTGARWTPPPYGFAKLNCDAATLKNPNRVGFGVIRDHHCNVFSTISSSSSLPLWLFERPYDGVSSIRIW